VSGGRNKIAEMRYGRQGGGWVDDAQPAAPPKAPKRDEDPRCTATTRLGDGEQGRCEKRYSDHSGDKCEFCGDNVEHHDTAGAADCMANRARLAAAKSDAGLELSGVERKVLRRVSDPDTLTSGGYVPRSTIVR
jgi:hypothetical protein